MCGTERNGPRLTQSPFGPKQGPLYISAAWKLGIEVLLQK